MLKKGGVLLAMVMLGVAIAVGVFIALLSFEFTLKDLAYYVPALLIAGFLIIFGRARLKLKKK